MSIIRHLAAAISLTRVPSPQYIFALAITAFVAIGIVSPTTAAEIKLNADLGQTITSTDGGKIYLRINLRALKVGHREQRTPVNVALVLDRSGSMRGDRLDAAKEAAKMALSRLSRDDYVALVAYNQGVDILTRAGHPRSHSTAREKIDSLTANGTTALYAGVVEGGRQVEDYLSDRRVNRVILMSDGLANVGPSSPRELEKLGQELAGKGISVTTIGLGLSYNEDLMSRLALASDGNHAFAKTPDDLVRIFNSEFGDTLSIAAQDIEIIIECREGFTPKRILGRRADIDGQRVRVKLNQLTGGAERYLIVELEAQAGRPAGTADVAKVNVNYLDLDSGSRGRVEHDISTRYSSDPKEAEGSLNKSVMSQVTAQVATETSERAVDLRDKGDLKGAKLLLESNVDYLKRERQRLGTGANAAPPASISALGALAKESDDAASNLDEKNWARTRKSMRYQQHKSKRQQTY